MLEGRLTFADVEVDLLAMKATRAGRPVPLRHKELKLLLALARHYPEPVSHYDLHIEVLGRAWQAETNSVQVQVSHLRERLGEPLRNPEIIMRVRYGYRLAAKPTLTLGVSP